MKSKDPKLLQSELVWNWTDGQKFIDKLKMTWSNCILNVATTLLIAF